MKQLNQSGNFQIEIAAEIAEIRLAASTHEPGIRTLREIEMGWVAGGDGQPVWPY